MNDIPKFSGVLAESALKYVQAYKGKTVVIKFGGELVAQDSVIRNLIRQAVHLKALGAKVLLVHGGGTQITDELTKAGIESKIIGGFRFTTQEALDITHRCLNELNRKIVNILHEEGSRLGVDVAAFGLGGVDGKLIIADTLYDEQDRFAGSRTGDIEEVDGERLMLLCKGNGVPILHPICSAYDGGCMNVNADDVAAAIATAVDAHRLILCSNIPGVMDKQKNVISKIYTDEIDALIADETVTGGMIPKVRAAAETASDPHVGGVVILDGQNPTAIEKELFTDEGSGTLILRREIEDEE